MILMPNNSLGIKSKKIIVLQKQVVYTYKRKWLTIPFKVALQ